MAFGDPVADIGGYGQGFGGPNDPDDERSIFEFGIPKPTPLLGLLTEEEAMDITLAPRPNAVPPNLSYSPTLDEAGFSGYITGSGLLNNAMEAIRGIRNMFGPTYGPNAPPVNVPGYDFPGHVGQSTKSQQELDQLEQEAEVFDLDNAYAQVGLEPNYNYVNPAVEAAAIKAAQETAQELGIGASITGLGVVGAMPAVKTGMDALLDFMDVDFGTYGPDIPGRAQDDVFEPSMDLQMEFGPVMDSDLEGVEGFMEAGGFQGGGSGVIGPDFDMGAVSEAGGEALQEALAQRVAETIIAQQAARQVTPESNKVTIPTSSGPDIVIDVTPSAPQKVAPQRRTAPKPSPVKIAATSVAKPKAFKKLPKFAQKEIRQGRVPTGGSDNVQDMVRAFLGGQEAFGDSGTRK